MCRRWCNSTGRSSTSSTPGRLGTASRAPSSCAAVKFYLDADMAATLQRVVDEYARRAETDEELRTAHEDARALVEEEPW